MNRDTNQRCYRCKQLGLSRPLAIAAIETLIAIAIAMTLGFAMRGLHPLIVGSTCGGSALLAILALRKFAWPAWRMRPWKCKNCRNRTTP